MPPDDIADFPKEEKDDSDNEDFVAPGGGWERDVDHNGDD